MYYIYHIPGIKVGCTSRDPKKRVNEQGYTDFEILETHDDIDQASIRELELQNQYGYEVEKFNFKQQFNAGKNGGLSKSEIKISKLLQNRITWKETSKRRDPLKVIENARNNGGTHKHRDCQYCGRTINLMNIGRHENNCKNKGA